MKEKILCILSRLHPMQPEHHTVIIVGGGPAGLSLAVVLGGHHPYYRDNDLFRAQYGQLADYLSTQSGSLLSLDFRKLVQAGMSPVDLFRILHHPSQSYRGPEHIGLDFREAKSIDYLLLSREPVGGIWNHAPEHLLTLSPGHWMELAFYPLAQYASEERKSLDPDALISKQDLIDYYHAIPDRFGQTDRIKTNANVSRIESHERGFLVTSQEGEAGLERQYTCTYLLYAVGQRGVLRRLDVPGEDLPFVTTQYDRPEDLPGERIAVIGGGRSSDWAATELYDAGKQIYYVMRQSKSHHWQLINDSRYGLPYYARLAEILESEDPRFKTMYGTRVQQFEGRGDGGTVTVSNIEETKQIDVGRALIEIGGMVDYAPIQGVQKLDTVEKYDPYRFQCHQMPVHPHSYESKQIPNLYAGGYLAEGIGLVIIAMHGTTYAIAGDILRKEGAASA